MKKVHVQISAPLFGGFGVVFDKPTYDVLSDLEIISRVKQDLISYLSNGNFFELLDKAKKTKLHLDRSFSNPLKEDTLIVFACDHQHIHFDD
jgi:hypothetical protein